MVLDVPILSHFPLDPVSSLRYKTSHSLTLCMLAGEVMEPLSEPTNTVWSFPFTPQDWAHTPLAVQAYVCTLHDKIDQLQPRRAKRVGNRGTVAIVKYFWRPPVSRR